MAVAGRDPALRWEDVSRALGEVAACPVRRGRRAKATAKSGAEASGKMRSVVGEPWLPVPVRERLPK